MLIKVFPRPCKCTVSQTLEYENMYRSKIATYHVICKNTTLALETT